MVVFDGMSLIAKPSTVSFIITRVLFTQGFSAFSILCSHTLLLIDSGCKVIEMRIIY
jgi:hypothetical protein